MPKLDLLKQDGSKVEAINLSDYVFGIEPHQQALYDVANAQKAAMRHGNHDVKNRSEVRGGGRKPWRQKGTGRARHGSIRSPQWRGGGVVFGPTPRKYNIKLNQKVRTLALRSAYSAHVLRENLFVIDNLTIDSGKTKDFNKLLTSLNINNKTLFIVTEFNENVIRAARNIPYVAFSEVNHVSVYDLLDARNVVITKDALAKIEEVLGNE